MLTTFRHDCTGHKVRDTLNRYWLIVEQLGTPYYSNTMKHDPASEC